METSFGKDIRDLFRESDRNTMLRIFDGLDLWDHVQVSEWADRILVQLEAGRMPCDKAWPAEKIATFRKWIADGKPS